MHETVVLKSNEFTDKPQNTCYKYHDIVVRTNNGMRFWWTGTQFIQCPFLDTNIYKIPMIWLEWSDIDLSDDVRMTELVDCIVRNIKHVQGINILVYNEMYFNPSTR